MDDPTHTWRIFNEYCPFGSLEDLVAEHRRRRLVKARKGLRKGKYEQNIPLPEPFLWCVFEGLARAAVAMDTPPRRLAIGLPQQQVPMLGSSGGLQGELVVHQDIKPSNVFLGTPFNNHFQVYPQAKLGDFGVARLTRPQEIAAVNPAAFLDDGHTPGFEPPEIYRPNQPFGPGAPLVKAGSHTNIWQTGQTMRCLLRLEREQDLYNAMQNDFAHDHPCNLRTTPRANAQTANDSWVPQVEEMPFMNIVGNYSADLTDLVSRCLRVDHAGPAGVRRPTPAELLADIHAVWGAHLNGMDARTRPLVFNQRGNVKRLDVKDKYRVGFAAGKFPR